MPGHPIAGTEFSGPDAGFAELFEDRWCILTPPDGTDPAAVETVAALWRAAGSEIEIMDPLHHDLVLAMTSHLPHLIAYTIVGTATELEEDVQAEVVKFSAGGFRDFTRIAATKPDFWRDVFLTNREAVLEMLDRFTEDLSALRRAVRRSDADAIMARLARTQQVRKDVIALWVRIPSGGGRGDPFGPSRQAGRDLWRGIRVRLASDELARKRGKPRRPPHALAGALRRERCGGGNRDDRGFHTVPADR